MRLYEISGGEYSERRKLKDIRKGDIFRIDYEKEKEKENLTEAQFKEMLDGIGQTRYRAENDGNDGRTMEIEVRVLDSHKYFEAGEGCYFSHDFADPDEATVIWVGHEDI